jgi:competence protein ComEC
MILIISAAALGFIRFNYSFINSSDEKLNLLFTNSGNSEGTIFGEVIEQPETDSGRIKLILKCDSVSSYNFSGKTNFNLSVSVYANKFKKSGIPQIKVSDYAQVKGTIEKLPHRKNPGEFDYGRYLKLHDIDAVFSSFGFENINVLHETDNNFFKKKIIIPVKQYSVGIIEKLVGGEEGEFLKGLVLGERSNISKEVKQDFVNAGVSHIIAVSGLNVAYVIIVIALILQLFPLKTIYKSVIIFLFLIFYMNLTGNVPSIVRATIMASVFLYAQTIERKILSFNVISFAAIVILLIDPRQIFDAGFILSFWALISIILIYPKLHSLINNRGWYKIFHEKGFKGKVVKAVIALFFGTLAAQIGTLPITALMFKKISVVSLITNLFAIPLSNAALALGFYMILLSFILGGIAGLIAEVIKLILHYLLLSFSYLSSFSFSVIETYRLDYFFLLIFYLVVIILLFVPNFKMIVRLAAVFLLFLNYFIYADIIHQTDNLKIAFLDVGNSSACLITTPSNKNILINCGTSNKSYTSSERNVIPYLKMQGIDKIDAMFITSLNKDEYKSLREFCRSFKINKLYIPAYYKPIFENDEIGFSLKNNKMAFITNSFVVKNNELRAYCYYDTNITSAKRMIVNVMYGNESIVISDLKDDYDDNYFCNIINNCTILKASSSGSFKYNSEESIINSSPECIVISSSDRKLKRLKSDIFGEALEQSGYKILETGESGAVIFETDGESMDVVKWR